jgi:hypothetical protein
VPLLHADELYALRSQSEMVRRRLQLIVAGQPDPGLRLGGGDRARTKGEPRLSRRDDPTFIGEPPCLRFE